MKLSIKSTLNDGVPLPQRYGAIVAIALGIIMAVLDGTIANVSLPTIASDLNTDPSASVWILNAYQLAITISLLSLASLGDITGYRKIYLTGLILFSVTSLVCALSNSLLSLTLARILQGFGAAAIMSVNIALIRLIYPQRYLGRGIGINALIVSISAAAGPSVASMILSVASWPWLFAINVPLGVIAFIFGFKFLPQNPPKKGKPKFDKYSALLNALTFGIFIYAISNYTQDQNMLLLLAQLFILLIIGTLFIRRQSTQEFPLLPIDLLRIPIFSLSICTSICSFSAQMLAFVSLPFFLQTVLGKTEVMTGLLLTPWPIVTMIMAPISGRLIEKFNSGLLGSVGLMFFSLGLLSLALLPDTASDFDIIWRMALCGAGFGLFQSPNNHTIISSAPHHRSGGASGMLGSARLVGQTIGTALVALMFNLFGNYGTHSSLFLATICAFGAAIVSSLRIKQPKPIN